LRRIVFAYTVNQLGTWLAYVALLLSTYDHTHSTLAVAGLLVAGRLLPALFTPTLVAAVELARRRGSLSALYLLEGAAALALAALLWHFWLPGVLMLVAIDGTAALTAGALLRATAAHEAVEELGSVDSEDAEERAQRRANASLNLGFTVAVTLGPAVSGVIVAAAGSPTALLVDAFTFVACGLLLLGIEVHQQQEQQQEQEQEQSEKHQQPGQKQRRWATEGSIAGRLAAAARHLREVPRLRGLLLVEAAAIVCFAAVEPVEVVFVKSTLHAGDRGFGFLTAAWGIGMVIGGILFARALQRPLRPMLVWGTLAVGVAYIGFALSPTLAVACAAAVIGGLGNGVQWAALISSVQRLTPGDLLGRLMSTVEAIGAVCPAIGFAVGGVLGALTGTRSAMLIAGVAASAMTVAFMRVARGELAQRPRGGGEAQAAVSGARTAPTLAGLAPELSAEAAPEHR
jgi:MFS family permease